MTKKQIDLKLHELRITAGGYNVILRTKRYVETDRVAIVGVLWDGVPAFTLTVNIPEVKIKAGEIIVKTWSENERIAKDLLQSGLFEDTGRRIPTVFVKAQVWKVKP